MVEKLERSDARVLVVEDDDTTRALLVKLLHVMGAKEIFEAKEGGEGLTAVCVRKPDLIICDLHMAPVDGLSLLAGVRESCDEDVRKTKIVMFTADKDGEPMRRARRIGVSGYVSKPFHPNGFSAVVKTALGEAVQPAAGGTETSSDAGGTTGRTEDSGGHGGGRTTEKTGGDAPAAPS